MKQITAGQKKALEQLELDDELPIKPKPSQIGQPLHKHSMMTRTPLSPEPIHNKPGSEPKHSVDKETTSIAAHVSKDSGSSSEELIPQKGINQVPWIGPIGKNLEGGSSHSHKKSN